MEPARLRAILARAPGLVANHLFACRISGPAVAGPLPPDLLPRLLHSPLPARTRAWLEGCNNDLIDSDLRWIEANDCRIMCSLDPDFPPALAQLQPAPATLYVRGSGSSLRAPQLAIVGSRQASAAGKATAHRFAAELAQAGLGITSGRAIGIDTAAHEGALAVGGQTIAVCATGLDRVYPADNAGLAARIRAQGCLVSVFAPGTGPRPHHFAVRNRLIGALGAGTLVVEAAAESGSLITARHARRLNRPVFAVPGSIRDPQARGCNQLIRTGATLVQQSCEILQDLNITHNNQYVIDSPTARLTSGARPSLLDNKYEMLLDAAGFEPVDIDVLVFRTGWSAHTVTSMLLLLELQGRIAPQPGGRYCRLS